MEGQVITLDGKKWWVASIESLPPHQWAWLCRVDRPMDQCRLSLRAGEFKGVFEMKDDGAKGLDDRGTPSGIWHTTGRGHMSTGSPEG